MNIRMEVSFPYASENATFEIGFDDVLNVYESILCQILHSLRRFFCSWDLRFAGKSQKSQDPYHFVPRSIGACTKTKPVRFLPLDASDNTSLPSTDQPSEILAIPICFHSLALPTTGSKINAQVWSWRFLLYFPR
jgi:hypothetical protein